MKFEDLTFCARVHETFSPAKRAFFYPPNWSDEASKVDLKKKDFKRPSSADSSTINKMRESETRLANSVSEPLFEWKRNLASWRR